MRRSLIYGLILVAFCGGAVEGILRLRGVKPWRREGVSVTVEPGGKLYQPHPTLGYRNLPGRFTVTKRSGFSFEVTHLPNTLRATAAAMEPDRAFPDGEVWLFGCSFTYGWSLDDDQTYAWLLQEAFPDSKVVNFGVNGYGTLHSLLQFREALQAAAPRLAILAYASFHDHRNTFSRTRQKRVTRVTGFGPLAQPFARLDGDGRLQYFQPAEEYTEFPLMRRLALAHSLEMLYNRFELRRLRSLEVSRALVAEMARTAAGHEVPFVVAAIFRGGPMLEFAASREIRTIDIAVDLRRPENTNLPHDRHPSALANEIYASRLAPLLEPSRRSGGAGAAAVD